MSRILIRWSHACELLREKTKRQTGGHSTAQLVRLGEVAAAAAAVLVAAAHEGGAGVAGAPAGQRHGAPLGAARDRIQQVLAAHEPHVQGTCQSTPTHNPRY